MKTRLQITAADYRKLSDEELVHRYAHKNEHIAINVLFERYGHIVLGVCLKYLKTGEEATYATQQIFIKILDDLHRFHVDHFRSWLLYTARNFCLARLNKPVPLDQSFNSDDQESIDWHHKLEEAGMFGELDLMLARLTKEQRTCIELFYSENLSYKEIANKTNSTISEVKSRLQAGISELKNKLETLPTIRK